MCAVIRNEVELVKLHLARHPLSDNPKATDILRQSAFSSKPEVFKLILDSRSWNFDYVIDALRGCWCPNEKTEENAKLILDYCDKHFNSYIPEEETSSIIRILKAFIEAGMTETASRILKILPQCDFKRFDGLLANYSYRSYELLSSPKDLGLTQGQIEGIMSRCKPCTLKELTEYCSKVNVESKTLERDVDFRNKYHDEKLNKLEIMNDFFDVHTGIIQKLLDLVTEFENSDLIDSISRLANNGNIQLLEKLLVKYEKQLTIEDKLSIIKKTKKSLFENGPALSGLEYFFSRYNRELTNEQCLGLLEGFSKPPFNNISIVEKIIEMRPRLEINFGSQLEEIKNKCNENRY
jgi:chemotaxis regulatin CheY-phosphate phosphatase CheZ